MKILKKYWHVLTISFVFFTSWLWAFPMYGPLLANLAGNTSNYFMIFLISHALGILSYGYLIEVGEWGSNFSGKKEIKLIIFTSFLVSLLTICIPYFPVNYLIISIIIIALLSGPLVVFYFYYLSLSIDGRERGRALGFILFLAGLIFIIFLLLPYGKWLFALIGIFLLCPLFLLKFPLQLKEYQSELDIEKVGKSYWISLILLIVLFYLGSGLMYNLLYADIMTIDSNYFNIGFLFYPLVVLPAGFLADKKGRKLLISLGLSLAGIAYLFLLLFEILNSFSLVLLQASFAVMDLFLFLTFMDWTDYFTNRKVICTGLFLNVMVVFFSGLPFIGNGFSEIVPRELWPAFGLLSILLIAFPLIFISETIIIRHSQEVLENDYMDIDIFCNQYSISPREKEIIIFLLEGKKTKEITELLSISYNTLKTHLRNIYRKTETGGQIDLILFIWKSTKTD